MNPDLNAPVVQAQKNRQDMAGIFGSQRQESSDFLNRYKSAIGGQETMSAMAERIGKELNLPTLRSNANTINNTINNIPYTYGAATKGYNVNQNQLDRIIGTKTAELTPAMQSANSAVSSAENSLNTRMGYGQADQQKQLIPYQAEQSMLGERLARETSGYSSSMQGELDSIIAKMNAGVQISEGEKNRANQLAVAEQQFQNALKLQQNQQNFQSSQSTQDPYRQLSSGETLFDTRTGKPIYTAPKASGGSVQTQPVSISSYYTPAKLYTPATGGGGW